MCAPESSSSQTASSRVSAKAGTEITLTSSGAGEPAHYRARVRLGLGGPPVAFGIEMNGMSLAAFLDHVAREHGWALRYDEGALSQQAAGR